AVAHLNAELTEQLAQIDVHGLFAHPDVQVPKHMGAGRAVALVEGAIELPAHGVVAARGEDSAKRVVQQVAIARRAADLHIREQAEERAPPVRVTPGRRAIEPAIAGAWETFG